MTYPELKNIFQELKRGSPRENLVAHIIFMEDSFAWPFPGSPAGTVCTAA